MRRPSFGPAGTCQALPWGECSGRVPGVRVFKGRGLWTALSATADYVFHGCQLLQPDRTAGVQFPRGDANLCTHAEFATVGELGRRVDHDNSAVHSVKKSLRRCRVLRDDRLRVIRSMFRDVVDGRGEAVYGAHRNQYNSPYQTQHLLEHLI